MTPETFKAARQAANLTQIALTKISGVSERQIARYENGHSAIPQPMALLINGLATGQWPKRGR